MKKCHFCAHELVGTVFVCPNCGRDLDGPQSFTVGRSVIVVAAFVVLGVMLWIVVGIDRVPSTAQVAGRVVMPAVSICEAAGHPVGERILVWGEFRGTDSGATPTSITLSSDGICSVRGGGLLFATVNDHSEMKKVDHAMPKSDRTGTPGTRLQIEGDLVKVDEGRFVHLARAIVR